MRITLTLLLLVPHISVSELGSVASGNSMSPVRRLAIIWTNADLFPLKSMVTKFSEIEIFINAWKCTGKCHLRNGRNFVYGGWVKLHKRVVICFVVASYTGKVKGLIQFNSRWHLTSIGNPIVEIRRSYDRLISTMGFPILVRCHLYI